MIRVLVLALALAADASQALFEVSLPAPADGAHRAARASIQAPPLAAAQAKKPKAACKPS